MKYTEYNITIGDAKEHVHIYVSFPWRIDKKGITAFVSINRREIKMSYLGDNEKTRSWYNLIYLANKYKPIKQTGL